MTDKPKWTRSDFRLFELLTERASSTNGAVRVIARVDLSVFQKRVGKDVCAAMWAKIKARDAATPKRTTQ